MFFLWAVFYSSASFIVKSKPEFHVNLSPSIFVWTEGLNGTVIWYTSGMDISEYLPTTKCDIESTFLWEANNIYFYHIVYNDICEDNTLSLEKDGENIFSSSHVLNFFKEFDLYNKFTDYPTTALEEIYVDLSKKERTLQAYKTMSSQTATNFLEIQKKRKYDEVLYVRNIIWNIIEGRNHKYLVPVRGYPLPTQHAHIPNYSREYRASYTDGIHHWWDIFAPKNTPVQALDSWIIIRVVDDFVFDDLKQIKRWSLSEVDKLENLDLLRGNQVWLKTMKGEVVFYSHLETVEDSIQVWDFVSKWANLGWIGVSWVPAIDYNDYHLHFAIQENPYNIKKAGKYSFLDYMSWDWLLKWLDLHDVQEEQNEIFVK